MKKAVLAGAAAAVAFASSFACAGDVKGFGTAACGELVQNWNTSDLDTRGMVVIAVGQWAFGYLSGRNAELPRHHRKELKSLDNDETALFIITQCASYPNLRVYQIADVIFDAAPYVSGSV